MNTNSITKDSKKVKKLLEGKRLSFSPGEVESPQGWVRLYSSRGFWKVCFPSKFFYSKDSRDLEEDGIVALNRGKGKRFIFSILLNAIMESLVMLAFEGNDIDGKI